MVGTVLVTTMTQNNQRSLGVKSTTTRRLTKNSLIIQTMTTTRMSVARNAFTKLSKNLKSSLRNRKLNSLFLYTKKN